MREPLTSISLFSGAGGLDVGLEQAGFRTCVFVDMDPISCKTLRANFPDRSILCKRVEDLSTEEILDAAGLKVGEVDLLAGGPPCQPFSKSRHWVLENRGLNDPRASTLWEFVRVLREAKPRAFIMENVHGLKYRIHKDALQALLKEIKAAGYTANAKVLCAADYGVPQIRYRLFVIGARDGLEVSFPPPTHAPQPDLTGLKPYVTAGEAIGDLNFDIAEVPEELKVKGKWGHLLPQIPPGDNYLFFTAKRGHHNPIFKWRSRYWSFLLKLSPDRPSWTIQAQPGPYVGPFHWDNRRLTVLELKRLQTFPDEYIIKGNYREAHRQIGNAVPPLLAKILGENLKRQIARHVAQQGGRKAVA